MSVPRKEPEPMSAPSPATTAWQWPADVLEFAARENVQQYLDPLLDATRLVFPTARRIHVSLEDDPQRSAESNIVFDVQVPGPDVPNYVEAQQRWIRQLYRFCPAPLVCTFCLVLEPIS